MDKGELGYAAQPVKQRPNQTQARFATRVKLTPNCCFYDKSQDTRELIETITSLFQNTPDAIANGPRKAPDNNRQEPRTQTTTEKNQELNLDKLKTDFQSSGKELKTPMPSRTRFLLTSSPECCTRPN